VRSIDVYNAFGAWAIVVVGLAAIVGEAIRGELGLVGMGLLALLIGSGLVAYLGWDRRNPLGR
jgi:hypothetical protein